MKWSLWIGLLILSVAFVSGCTSQTGQITSSKTSDTSQAERMASEIESIEQEPVCIPNWQCTDWSECSSDGVQIRTCTDSNSCGVTEGKPDESEVCIPPQVTSGILTINKVQITVGNLYPTRVTVENTGNTKLCPEFDIYVYDLNDNEICYGSPVFGMPCISAGNKKTDEISILGCMFEEDGTYILKIDLLDEDYNILDSKQKTFEVDYWNKYGL